MHYPRIAKSAHSMEITVIFKSKSEGFWDKVSSTIEVLDEDKLMSYAFDNREDNDFEAKLKELYVSPKPTFAFQTPVEDKYNDY